MKKKKKINFIENKLSHGQPILYKQNMQINRNTLALIITHKTH